MYNYSGIIYRIFSVGGVLLLIGIVCILLDKPWKPSFSIQKCKVGIGIVTVSLCLTLFYASSILFPAVSSYTGAFIDTHRNSRVAPPLPFTYQYVFWNGTGKKEVVYLDAFSIRNIFPKDFEIGQTYTIFYDKRTGVLLKVVEIVDE